MSDDDDGEAGGNVVALVPKKDATGDGESVVTTPLGEKHVQDAYPLRQPHPAVPVWCSRCKLPIKGELFATVTMPHAILLTVTTGLGFVAGLLVATFRRRK